MLIFSHEERTSFVVARSYWLTKTCVKLFVEARRRSGFPTLSRREKCARSFPALALSFSLKVIKDWGKT